MPRTALLVAVAAGAGVIAGLGSGALIPVLRRAAVLDRPNERSLHAAPTPRGGGIALVAAILAAWLALIGLGALAPTTLPIPAGAVLLAAISWLDDLRGLTPAARLVAQIAAVALGVLAQPAAGLLFQGWLPTVLDRAAMLLLWVYFINLFNFMDGIDGLAGSETAAIGLGLVAFAGVGLGWDPGLAALGGAIAAAAIGFLMWNWAPARIFLGDVGSVPLGYLLGFLLLDTASRGHWKIALILPLYFLADATITLLRRVLRGERVWQAHREHFYQHAVQLGRSHAAVVWRVGAVNAALIGCGWLAENGWDIAGLAIAAPAVAVLLAWMAAPPRSGAE
jgi:UDP-N-acetylmuramyl pentapeptide phosphotransferase/UDP-N-acetylglucosamine-1-phosphate transferase